MSSEDFRPGTDTAGVLSPADPLSEDFRALVGASISAFVAGRGPELAAIGTELDPVIRIVAELTAGGKRLRPAFCYWGHVAAAGAPADRGRLITAAASLELLHVSALVHDDVMDASDLRRGRPATHRRFESMHTGGGWLGDSETFGRAGAILLGDLLLIWSMQMLRGSGTGTEALDQALPIMEMMRTEVTAGQFLDVMAQAQDHFGAGPAADDRLRTALDEAERVVEYKSARYTVRRPVQFGAALGGASARLQDQLAEFGSPLGRAFQYRDDVLGVFGDSAITGKPSGDDLREGKRTVLVAQAMAAAAPAGRRLLEAGLGNPELDPAGVADLQQVITESGARDAVEQMIGQDHERALSALAAAEITDDGRTALAALADAAVRRNF